MIRLPKSKQSIYIPTKYKLVLATAFACAWCGISTYIALPWIDDISIYFSKPGAWIIIFGIALLPGYANAFILCGLFLDRRPQYQIPKTLPPVSILIATYNEADSIKQTIFSINSQHYPGLIEIIVINDGSTDNSKEIVERILEDGWLRKGITLKLINFEINKGKSHVLNSGLQQSSHEYIITVDADSYLFTNSLTHLVTNMVLSSANTAAVAGTVLVRNSRTNIMTKLQEWEYFQGIAVVKRIQSLFQGTLVAQGAFSVYRKTVLNEAGGWPHSVGEDIVLTWWFLKHGYRVAYAENAFVFTNVPESYSAFYRQRKRWARGMIEAFKAHFILLLKPRLVLPFIYLNLLFPYLDFAFLFVFIPALIAALFFNFYALVGVMTLYVLPLSMILNVFMFVHQNNIFKKHGLHVRRNKLGVIFYILAYQIILAPASVMGYCSELLNRKKTW